MIRILEAFAPPLLERFSSEDLERNAGDSGLLRRYAPRNTPARSRRLREDLRRARRVAGLLGLHVTSLAVEQPAAPEMQQAAVAPQPLRFVERAVGELQQLLGRAA